MNLSKTTGGHPYYLPCWAASMAGHLNVLELMAKRSPVTELMDVAFNGNTMLMAASFHGRDVAAEWLLEKKAGVNAPSASISRPGFTALHLAAMRGHVRCCKMLLAARADVL